MNAIGAVLLFFLCYLVFFAGFSYLEGFYEERKDRMTSGR